MQRTSLWNEHGQSVVLIALVMVVLIGFMGLIIDGGQAYLTRRDSQDAADAGAYAGARVFAARTDSSAATTQAIWTAIYSYALANRVAGANDMTAWFVDANSNNVITITAPF
ncbi:MAG: pilus assembly protein TadG-related protein, partial [Rudaea sp.]